MKRLIFIIVVMFSLLTLGCKPATEVSVQPTDENNAKAPPQLEKDYYAEAPLQPVDEYYFQYSLIIKNMDPVVYNNVKFYIDSRPYQINAVPQGKEWKTHFFATEEFTLKIEALGYEENVFASRDFTFYELYRHHPNCEAISFPTKLSRTRILQTWK